MAPHLRKLVTFVVICSVAACALIYEVGVSAHSIMHFLIVPIAYAYFWIPLLFVAYWIGCKKVTWTAVLAFAVVETAAVLFVILDASMHLYILIYQ